MSREVTRPLPPPSLPRSPSLFAFFSSLSALVLLLSMLLLLLLAVFNGRPSFGNTLLFLLSSNQAATCATVVCREHWSRRRRTADAFKRIKPKANAVERKQRMSDRCGFCHCSKTGKSFVSYCSAALCFLDCVYMSCATFIFV